MPYAKIEVRARRAALATLNAFLASGTDDERTQLYRTLGIEVFPTGIQFIGCDGTMLFRTWAPSTGNEDAPMPRLEESPDCSVVVMDTEKFAQSFMRALLSACVEANEFAPLDVVVDRSDLPHEPPLGEPMYRYAITFRALGQELHCRLLDQPFVGWRAAHYGLGPDERVDGMRLSPRLFATAGKLRGVTSLECTFKGDERAIAFEALDGLQVVARGLLMPMRRFPEKPATPESAKPESAED